MLLTGSYDPLIVTLSIVIAIAASYAALDLAGRVTANRGGPFAAWLAGGSIAMGIGIWSMHFTAMLAFRLPVPVGHYWPTTLLSFVVAVLAATLALSVVSRKQMTGARAVTSGVSMGCGIAGLHYMNMTAMRMAAETRFHPLLVALSVAFAIAFSYPALRFSFYFRDPTRLVWRKVGSALVMAAAICAMHYTGMAAASFTASGVPPNSSHSVTVTSLGTIGLITVTLLVLGFAILSSYIDRRFHTQAVELALAQARMEFADIGRAASLGELAASIAHEINQPLGAIANSASACLRWLAAQPPNLDEAREAASNAVRESNRASEVITRIRALLKKEALASDRVDLNEVIREVLSLTSNEIAQERIAVRADLAASLPFVLGDRVQLKQLVLNLVTNAIEAMTSVQNRPRELRIQSAMDSDAIEVSVQDTGTGLDREQLDRMFQPFFTTKQAGIGMGLSISRSIVEAHGGRLWAVSLDSHGAVFHFTLPKAHGVT
jgi:NO-binding membrane sensor protein with MHYT domain/nitrogen-specific signal transduction histidine kinase